MISFTFFFAEVCFFPSFVVPAGSTEVVFSSVSWFLFSKKLLSLSLSLPCDCSLIIQLAVDWLRHASTNSSHSCFTASLDRETSADDGFNFIFGIVICFSESVAAGVVFDLFSGLSFLGPFKWQRACLLTTPRVSCLPTRPTVAALEWNKPPLLKTPCWSPSLYGSVWGARSCSTSSVKTSPLLIFFKYDRLISLLLLSATEWYWENTSASLANGSSFGNCLCCIGGTNGAIELCANLEGYSSGNGGVLTLLALRPVSSLPT